jgi:hypothetical protein
VHVFDSPEDSAVVVAPEAQFFVHVIRGEWGWGHWGVVERRRRQFKDFLVDVLGLVQASSDNGSATFNNFESASALGHHDSQRHRS